MTDAALLADLARMHRDFDPVTRIETACALFRARAIGTEQLAKLCDKEIQTLRTAGVQFVELPDERVIGRAA